MITRKILILEDEIIASMTLKLLLEHWGYETYEASSGKEAIEMVRHKKIDLALMDINLKCELNGIEIARQIRLRFGIPSIFITGYSDKETIEKAKIVKPVGYFIKPLNFNKLKLTIDSFFLERKENLKEKRMNNPKIKKKEN